MELMKRKEFIAKKEQVAELIIRLIETILSLLHMVITNCWDKDDPDVLKIDLAAAHSQLWIQAGANANQGINISLVDGTAAGLGLTDVSVLSNTAAGTTIQTVDDAISQVNRYRSDFGAQQNRLEHAMAVDDNTAENLQAAESRIRDLDMADEMLENAKLAIMEQSMQAMLANANRQTEGVLALLQG